MQEAGHEAGSAVYRWHGAGGKEAKPTWDSHSNAVCTQEVVPSHLHMPMYSVSLSVLPTSTSRLEGEIIFILVTCRRGAQHKGRQKNFQRT